MWYTDKMELSKKKIKSSSFRTKLEDIVLNKDNPK